MKYNSQSIEKQHLIEDGSLDVVSVWPTIQGEGPFAGEPATFVRLAGCNFKCAMCDTDYTKHRSLLSVDQLLHAVRKRKPPTSNLVVITGGEPFRQNLVPFIVDLVHDGYKVQIETNGSLTIPAFCWSLATIVVSPKSAKVHDDIREHATAWKFVVESGCVDDDGFPTRVLGIGMKVARPESYFPRHKIYIQPLDEQDQAANEKHVQTAVGVCMRHGYRLCLQMQKIVGVP